MPILNNPRHEHFATLIASGLDPTNAYIAVGYSRKSAHASANRLQRNATVAARLTELKVAVAERTIEKAAVDRAWVISRLMSNVERCRQAEPVFDREGKPTGEYRFDSTGSNKALELLGRALSLFVDRTEHTGTDTGPLEVQMRLERLSMEDLLKLQEIYAKAGAEPVPAAGDSMVPASGITGDVRLQLAAAVPERCVEETFGLRSPKVD